MCRGLLTPGSILSSSLSLASNPRAHGAGEGLELGVLHNQGPAGLRSSPQHLLWSGRLWGTEKATWGTSPSSACPGPDGQNAAISGWKNRRHSWFPWPALKAYVHFGPPCTLPCFTSCPLHPEVRCWERMLSSKVWMCHNPSLTAGRAWWRAWVWTNLRCSISAWIYGNHWFLARGDIIHFFKK